MFVGSVVAGCIVLASHGAKARGALLRDVAAYAIAAAVVAGVLLTGRVSVASAASMVALYVCEAPRCLLSSTLHTPSLHGSAWIIFPALQACQHFGMRLLKLACLQCLCWSCCALTWSTSCSRGAHMTFQAMQAAASITQHASSCSCAASLVSMHVQQPEVAEQLTEWVQVQKRAHQTAGGLAATAAVSAAFWRRCPA